jgi:signal transduction histidine kinase
MIKQIKTLLFFIILLAFIGCNKTTILSEGKNDLYNNTLKLIKSSRNTSFTDSLRNNYLVLANKNIERLSSDSLKIKLLIKTAYSNLLLGNLDTFGRISKKTLQLTRLNNDTINKARAYSDLGYYFRLKSKLDSAFYHYNKSLKIHKLMGNNLLEGDMLLSMATIQSISKDYIGSEINTIKAISKLKNTNKYRSLFLCYNNLAFISNQLNKYEKSIEYRLKGLEYLFKLEGVDNLKIVALNGIGITYHDKGDYTNAIKYFNECLSYKGFFENDRKTYALLVDNLAYSKFKLGRKDNLFNLLNESFKIRDSLKDTGGLIMSNLHLAEYFWLKNDISIAIQHALKAKELAEQSNLNIDLLESYLLLSKLEPPEKGKIYLNKYIKLSDSLQQVEREIREKFTRIAYETDEITKEKKEVEKKNWLLTITLIIGAAFATLIFIYIRQRSKNKELELNKKQDEANVEIYNLMLSQQSKFQEGSNKEKERIAEELHDGILGRLFGTRLSLDSLNEGITEEEVKEREEYIEELNIIEEDIRKISHNLKTSLFNSNTSYRKLVEELVTKQSNIGSFECKLNFNNLTNWESISNSIKINCYRILQESLQNINKYAKASEVTIEFCEEGKNLILSVKDNGLGYVHKNKNTGIGQKNMISRAKSLKGKVEFISSLGKGTEVIIKIPL